MKNMLEKIKHIFKYEEEESLVSFTTLKLKIKKRYVEKLLIVSYLIVVFSLIKIY